MDFIAGDKIICTRGTDQDPTSTMSHQLETGAVYEAINVSKWSSGEIVYLKHIPKVFWFADRFKKYNENEQPQFNIKINY